jgi:protein-tyrosine phosphatase
MFRVLFVCTGNRCRSPFAAASFARIAEGLPVEVESAGTADLGPVPPTVDAIRVADEHGVDVTRHAARSLDLVDASTFDAVIGFERNHIAAAVVEAGAPHERAFLLPELERLLREVDTGNEHADPIEQARAVLARAHGARGQFVPGEEVDDPIGRPLRKYQEVFAEIDELNEAIVDALFAGVERTSAPDVAAATETDADAESIARVWGSSEPASTNEDVRARVWGSDVATETPDASLEEPAGEAEPAAHESPVPEATST